MFKFFFPLALITGLGSSVILNRNLSKNSEEVEMNVMSGETGDIEKNWGEDQELKNKNKKLVSFWKKDSELGFKRNLEKRRETHRDIYIFDLCNEWVKFAKSSNSDDVQRSEGEEVREKDETEGYGYTWKDVCQIVKNGNKENNWLKFVTKVMKIKNLIRLVENGDRCCGTNQKVCNDMSSWEDGKWLKKCFERELEKSKSSKPQQNEKRKICNSIWDFNKSKGVEAAKALSENNNCVDEDIIQKISKRIKVSRNAFEGINESSNTLCKDENGYKGKNGDGKIQENCKKKLAERIQKLIEEGDSISKEKIDIVEESKNCMGFYNIQQFEVKCKDGWVIKSAKSY